MLCRKISWRNDAQTVRVTLEKWNELLDQYRANPEYTEVNYQDERRLKIVFWFGKFQINVSDPKYPVLYVGTPDGDLIRYVINAWDDEKNDGSRITGGEAYKIVCGEFKRREGVSIGDAFGHVDPTFKKYVKPAIIEINDRYAGQNVYGVYKADFSSAYPAASCGRLPDASTAIRLRGRVNPSPEYPFAFYASGHLAEYGVYNTTRWIDTFYGKYIKLRKGQKRKDEYDTKTVALRAEDDETILMKSSDFELTNTMNALYNKRKNDEDIKTAMIAFFGYCQSLKFNKARYAHIVAVVYARHIQRMIDTTKNLKKAGCVPLMWATDSIAWRGAPPDGLCAEQKTLGAFFIEYKNAILRYRACGVYALQDLKTREIFIVKHQGMKIPEGFNIEKLSDIDKLTMTVPEIQPDGKIERIEVNDDGTAKRV